MFGLDIIPWGKIINGIMRNAIIKLSKDHSLKPEDITLVVFVKGDYLDVRYDIYQGDKRLTEVKPEDLV